MTPKLSTRSLRELIGLFERSGHGVVDAQGHRLHGVPAWDLARRSTLTEREVGAWMQRIGFAGSYPAPCGEESVPVELIEDADPTRYRYRCPETFRTKYVAVDQVGVHAVKHNQLLHRLADLMEIPQAHRAGIDAPAIEGTLWRLGKMRVGQAHVDIWLSRGLLRSIDAVFAHLRQPALPDQGVVFTTGQPLPELVPPPRAYRVIPIAEVLVDHTEVPTLDVDLVHRLLVVPSGSTPQKSLPVRFDPYAKTLVIATKSSPPWAIKGGRQLAVVRYLFEQLENGRRWVPAHEILNHVYGAQAIGRSRRVQNIFSGNTFWEDYIAGDSHGLWGFNLD